MTEIRVRPESVGLAILLTAVGGYLDAYTYVRHRVFANAQSGNVVLLAVDLSNRRWSSALARLLPILAFGVGVLLVEILATDAARTVVRRPVRVALAAEIVLLAIVASLPAATPAAIVTITVSFGAAIQFDTFRHLGDATYTTLMATGNLRSLIAAAFRWRATREAGSGRRALRFTAVVVAFAAGAVVGALITRRLGNASAGVPAGLLVLALGWLVLETRSRERAGGAS